MNNLARKEHPLAGIQRIADEALEREHQSPTIPSQALKTVKESSTIIVAGFAIHDEAFEEAGVNSALKERRENVARYHKNRDEAVKTLEQRGITPLAIVPTVAWERLCEKTGLFRIRPDHSGNVELSGAMLDGFERPARKIAEFIPTFMCWVILPVIVAYAISLWSFVHSGDILAISAFKSLAPAGITLFVSMLTGVVLFSDKQSTRVDQITGWLVGLQIRLFTKKSWKSLLKHFLPNGTSPRSDSRFRNLSAKVILPQPPADVAAILLKAKGLDLRVAAVAEAIAFAESPGDILRREHKRMMDEQAQQRERERQARLDPIIYIEHGSAVAIIAQFGEFPIEQEVVNQVMNSEFLI